MRYEAGDITPIDALDFVRNNPGFFFPGGVPAPLPYVGLLVEEVFALGASRVSVDRRGEWWVVASDRDWFLPDQSAWEQVRKLVPLPQLAPNTCRAEIVLVVYADAVATCGGDGAWVSLSGEGLPEGIDVTGGIKVERALAFRFSGPTR